MHSSHSPVEDVDDCKAACTYCGGLECFERPRFFCGQLLTDRDLDAAQRYVIEKNKLHNRYLYGAGVVCGLGVHCGRCCDCCVTVQPGYAIDCCGNDIVVCEPTTFDVCGHIDRCFCRADPCLGTRAKPEDCDDRQPRTYLLVISYAETPHDPVTAFGVGARCGCGGDCGCGGGCGGNCGCGGGGHAGKGGCGCGRTKPKAPTRGRCEPSRIHEGFRLSLVPQPKTVTKIPPFAKNLDAHTEFNLKWNAVVKVPTPFAAARDALIAQRDLLLHAIDLFPLPRCHMRPAVLAAVIPQSDAPGWTQLKDAAAATFADAHLQIDRGLAAAALADLCPTCDDAGDAGVVLASIRVQAGKVLQVNNAVRTTVITPRLMGDLLRSIAGPAMSQLMTYLNAGGPMAVEPELHMLNVAAAGGPAVAPAPPAPPPDSLAGRLSAVARQAGEWLAGVMASILPEPGRGGGGNTAGGPNSGRGRPRRGGNP
jgi:hypothetical protein